MSEIEPKHPIVSVLMVSYNTKILTLEALHTLYKETNLDFEVIVVDNASSDGSVKEVAEKFPQVTLIQSQQNLGFASGNNVAAGYATGDYLLLLNPDTEILEKAVDRLIDFADNNPDSRIWGGRTLFPDRSLNPSSCWAKQTHWSLVCQALGLTSLFRKSTLFNPEGIGGWDRKGEREVDIVSGCFFLIKRDFWLSLNGFHADFFMYGEEADLCLRAKEFGAKPVVTSMATIVHYGGASEPIKSDKLVRLLKAKQLLIQKHFPGRQKYIAGCLLALWPVSRLIAHCLLNVLGRQTSKDSFGVWRNVLKRRGDWV